MSTTTPNYRIYLKAWLILLGITVLMLLVQNPSFLVAGMAAKATIIALWFMHLKYERLDFTVIVAVSIVLFSLVLFGLIAPDGLAM
jgi:hypothetical protein